jgi:hypothetical protein
MVDTIRLYPPAAERSDRTLTVYQSVLNIYYKILIIDDFMKEWIDYLARQILGRFLS